MLLNYDLVLVALLADGLAGTQPGCAQERCVVHPLARRPICKSTSGIAFAADALILLGWHKLQDDLLDEGAFRKGLLRLVSLFLKKSYRKASARRPELNEQLCEAMQLQTQLEKSGCRTPDQASDPSGRMLGALFAQAAAEETQQPILYRCGMLLGRMIYYLDAAEDFALLLGEGADVLAAKALPVEPQRWILGGNGRRGQGYLVKGVVLLTPEGRAVGAV